MTDKQTDGWTIRLLDAPREHSPPPTQQQSWKWPLEQVCNKFKVYGVKCSPNIDCISCGRPTYRPIDMCKVICLSFFEGGMNSTMNKYMYTCRTFLIRISLKKHLSHDQQFWNARLSIFHGTVRVPTLFVTLSKWNANAKLNPILTAKLYQYITDRQMDWRQKLPGMV